jgi:O-methyltransferase
MVKFLAKGINFLAGNLLKAGNVFLSSSLDNLGRDRIIDRNYFDYIRLATLELICYEIKKNGIMGNVAELGVYKGKFARYINQHFPDRKLYLFDTFEGFDAKDLSTEKNHAYSIGGQNFSQTSVASVLAEMPFPENCIAVKGFFPASARTIEDSFAFVSLDADLYDPIYSGLEYFYPRLAKGGYVLVHDFNNEGYKGTRKAVEQFCQEENLGFTPLPDSGGSAVIAK